MTSSDIPIHLEESFPKSSSSSPHTSLLNPPQRPSDHANRRRSNSQSQVVARPSATRSKSSSHFANHNPNNGSANNSKLTSNEQEDLVSRNLNEYYVTLSSLNDTFIERKLHIPHLPNTLELGRPTGSKVKSDVNNAYFDSRVLSRRHAEMYYDPDQDSIMIRDLKSSNGTFVNDVKLATDPVPITEGDVINLGFHIQQESSHKQISAKVKSIKIMANILKNPAAYSSGSKSSAKDKGLLPALNKLQNSDNYDFKHLNFIQDIFTQLPDQSAFPDANPDPRKRQKGVRGNNRKNIKRSGKYNSDGQTSSFDNALFSDINPNVEESLLGLSTRANTGIFNNSQITNATNLDLTYNMLVVNMTKVKQQNATLKSLENFVNNYQSKLSELNNRYINKEVEKQVSRAKNELQAERSSIKKRSRQFEETAERDANEMKRLEQQLESLRKDNNELQKSLTDQKQQHSDQLKPNPKRSTKSVATSHDSHHDREASTLLQSMSNNAKYDRSLPKTPMVDSLSTSASTTSTTNVHATASTASAPNSNLSGRDSTSAISSSINSPNDNNIFNSSRNEDLFDNGDIVALQTGGQTRDRSANGARKSNGQLGEQGFDSSSPTGPANSLQDHTNHNDETTSNNNNINDTIDNNNNNDNDNDKDDDSDAKNHGGRHGLKPLGKRQQDRKEQFFSQDGESGSSHDSKDKSNLSDASSLHRENSTSKSNPVPMISVIGSSPHEVRPIRKPRILQRNESSRIKDSGILPTNNLHGNESKDESNVPSRKPKVNSISVNNSIDDFMAALTGSSESSHDNQFGSALSNEGKRSKKLQTLDDYKNESVPSGLAVTPPGSDEEECDTKQHDFKSRTSSYKGIGQEDPTSDAVRRHRQSPESGESSSTRTVESTDSASHTVESTDSASRTAESDINAASHTAVSDVNANPKTQGDEDLIFDPDPKSATPDSSNPEHTPNAQADSKNTSNALSSMYHKATLDNLHSKRVPLLGLSVVIIGFLYQRLNG